jgi:hypothetical protein
MQLVQALLAWLLHWVPEQALHEPAASSCKGKHRLHAGAHVLR